MAYSNNILETIGNTPLIKLNKITNDVEALVLAKVDKVVVMPVSFLFVN